jgi:hypothetical protein
MSFPGRSRTVRNSAAACLCRIPDQVRSGRAGTMGKGKRRDAHCGRAAYGGEPGQPGGLPAEERAALGNIGSGKPKASCSPADHQAVSRRARRCLGLRREQDRGKASSLPARVRMLFVCLQETENLATVLWTLGNVVPKAAPSHECHCLCVEMHYSHSL